MTVNSTYIGEHAFRCTYANGVLFVNGYFRLLSAVPDNTVLLTLANVSLLGGQYIPFYGYDLAIKGKMQNKNTNSFASSGTISAYSSYCYLFGFMLASYTG